MERLAARFLLGGQGLAHGRGYRALVVAVVLYEASKVYFTPGLLSYVPFSVSVPFLPVAWYGALRALVAAAILAMGGVGVVVAFFRAEVRDLLAATLIFCLIDAFLTLMIYGSGCAGLGDLPRWPDACHFQLDSDDVLCYNLFTQEGCG